MAGLANVSGLISGIPTDELIQKLMEIERRQIRQYESQQVTLNSRLSAYQEANTRLAALKDAAAPLANGAIFGSRTVTSSHADAVTATAGLGATPGDYTLTVESVARAHQVLTQSFADLNSTALGSGTLSITAGGETTTVTLDSSNNTLLGLRDAINRANSNVRAAIVQDGDASYRLMIAGKESGTANALAITSGLSGGTDPVFNDLQAARDAVVKLGTGEDAITMTRRSNTLQDLLPGVTLNLLAESPGTPITVTVAQDTAKIEAQVQKLVDQYNHAVDFFNKQFSFDQETSKGGALLADFTLRSAQGDLLGVFAGGVSGATGGTLADAGISMGSDGKLTLDSATLQDALASDADSVRRLFALTAEATHGGVQFVSVQSRTVVDGTPYAVEITQAARLARVTAGSAQAGVLGADEILTVNGVEIALTAGMSQAEVIQALNARSAGTGVKAAATTADGTDSGSFLTFRTVGYGSAATVSVVSSRSSAGGDSTGIGNVTATQASAGGETGAGTGEAGLDVAGTINGEAATGKGQLLEGNDGNATTDGLKLRITATTSGSLGTIQLFAGLAYSAEQTIDSITRVAGGPLEGEMETIDQRLQDIQELIDSREEAIRRREETLRLRFSQMEQALAQFQSQSASLASQLAALR